MSCSRWARRVGDKPGYSALANAEIRAAAIGRAIDA